ncbi:ferredoxin--NADP reductase [Paludibacterium denitrificans]|uniref:ferredoxin--NADP(+) reductase n=1 Tax=Paludibacterium denitrificans TaxID=2675226 RepID=A0A844GCI4_9NEIS|nr:ferredoxin--NADP reductase [Paludibacterium denitrificans]MTD33359.1 ferredoxin--NADP reductase [Paludibacterium denitrificans]
MAAPAEEKFTTERIIAWHRWHDKLLSFRLTRPEGYRFTPGQFARLGLPLGNGGFVWRAYSMVSANWDEHLEFYSIVVPDGLFTSRLALLGVGSEVLLDKHANGFFTVDRLPDGKDLWLLATGTGLAPYLSILQDPDVWQRFGHIVLVHGVRQRDDLTYQNEIRALTTHELWAEHGHKLRYLPVVTRDAPDGVLNQRLPALLANGELARSANLLLSPASSRFMICGNPAMVEATHRQLMSMGYQLSRLRAPGQIVLENGW